MAAQAKTVSPGERIKIVKARLHDGVIVADGSLQQHRAAIENQQLLIFRGVFGEAEALGLRRAVQAWAETLDPFPRGQSASRPGLNFHRLDDGTAPTTMPHIFHQFGFGDLAKLPRDLQARLTAIGAAVLEFRNELAGTRFELDGHGLRTKIIRHPCGGGFLIRHRHPYLPQRVSLFINLSQPGVDYSRGGLFFEADGAWVDVFEDFRLGDIIAWRYDLVHDVRPVDPDKPLTWEGDDGFWIHTLELDEVHKASVLAD